MTAAVIIFILSGLVFFFLGWVYVYDQDRAWEWRKRAARRWGLSLDMLERTAEWEMSIYYSGLWFIFFGVLTFIMALVVVSL